MTSVSVIIGQAESPAKCPSISVVGPPGITRPGESLTFSTGTPFGNNEGLSFHWTVSAGTIIKGEGTQVIEVQSTREMNNTRVTATIDISGLPKDCPRSASEAAAVSSGFHPTLVDELGRLPVREIRERLDLFLSELLANKDQVGFIVISQPENVPKGRLEQRLRIIKNHIFTFRKFPNDRVVILSDKGRIESTKLWRLPRENNSYFDQSGVIH